MTLTLIGQCPMSNTSELILHTTTCSSFKLLHYYFWVIVYTPTPTPTPLTAYGEICFFEGVAYYACVTIKTYQASNASFKHVGQTLYSRGFKFGDNGLIKIWVHFYILVHGGGIQSKFLFFSTHNLIGLGPLLQVSSM